MLEKGWHSKFPFKAKVFVSRVINDVFPAEQALRNRNIDNGSCSWCMVVLKNNRHCFLNCPMAKKVWELVDTVWTSVLDVSKRHFH